MKDTQPICVPHYEELSVKNILAQFKNDQGFLSFFPDSNNGQKLPDRTYFSTILNTMKPEYLKEVLLHAQQQRNELGLEKSNKEVILITEDWYQELLGHPFISSNVGELNISLESKGRTIHLLKASTKMMKPKTKRKKFELAVCGKRLHQVSNDTTIPSVHFSGEEHNMTGLEKEAT